MSDNEDENTVKTTQMKELQDKYQHQINDRKSTDILLSKTQE
jgi:hypothetical protein